MVTCRSLRSMVTTNGVSRVTNGVGGELAGHQPGLVDETRQPVVARAASATNSRASATLSGAPGHVASEDHRSSTAPLLADRRSRTEDCRAGSGRDDATSVRMRMPMRATPGSDPGVRFEVVSRPRRAGRPERDRGQAVPVNGAEQGMDRGRTGIGKLCSACVSGTGVDGGGVSVFSTMGAPVFLHATDATSRTIEDLQFTLGEGPCVDAASSGEPVHVPDLGAAEARLADRWPAFISEIAETDARALFAFPIRVGEYRARRRRPLPTDPRRARRRPGGGRPLRGGGHGARACCRPPTRTTGPTR